MKSFNPDCRTCPRIRHHLRVISEQNPTYHCAPVDGFGDKQAQLFVVGLAPGWHGANKTGRPFSGDHSGDWLFEQLHRLGLANRPNAWSIDDGLELSGCYLSNAVKCFPPDNAPSAREVKNCLRYLKYEISELPKPLVLFSLGKVAHDAILKAFEIPLSKAKFAHGAEHQLGEDIFLIDSFHCSKYNIQTGRLSKEQFAGVFDQAMNLLETLR